MKTISFVIPVYNEEARLEKTFAALQAGFSFDGYRLEEVIFVDDGSTDNTVAQIKTQKAGAEKALNAKVKVISYGTNKGKGYAVRTGMLASKSDYTLFFDADMSTPLPEFAKFIPFIEKGAEVVVGTRKNGHSTVVKHQPLYRELLGRGFTILTNIALNTWVTDFTCGFKVFARKAKDHVFAESKIDRWGYDAEIVYLARIFGYKIAEKSVTWANDDRTKVNLFKALPQTLGELVRIRANRYNKKSYVSRIALRFSRS